MDLKNRYKHSHYTTVFKRSNNMLPTTLQFIMAMITVLSMTALFQGIIGISMYTFLEPLWVVHFLVAIIGGCGIITLLIYYIRS